MTGGSGRPAVYLHVGEPKSGTTFLQHVLWGNRDVLAMQGLLLPGLHPQEHFRAQLDLRGIPQAADDPTGAYLGEWDLLARQAVRAERLAVISAEQLAAATTEQVARAIASLDGADVHVVLSVRDFASLLPAEWQETVKHRNQRPWPDWLQRVRAGDTGGERELAQWFWDVHDTPEVLRRWATGVAPERIHVVTLPRPGAPREVLWQRFAGVLGIDPASARLDDARPNESLGLAEAEVLRRLNTRLTRRDVGPYAYRAVVKERLAHGYLAQRPAGIRPELPAEVAAWAESRARTVVTAIRAAGYDVRGDLAELLPADPSPRAAATAVEPPADAVLDAAVGALATVLELRHAPQARATAPGALPTVLGRLAANPRVRRTVRDLSSRYPVLGRLRVAAWRVSDRARRRLRPTTVRPAR